MPYDREKEQVIDGLNHNGVPIQTQNRFIAFTQHPVCDQFIKQACDYIDIYFSRQRAALRQEKQERRRCIPSGLRGSQGAHSIHAKDNTQDRKENRRLGTLESEEKTRQAQRAKEEKEEQQMATCLDALSNSYLFILFNFSDFGKPVEDECFFLSVHRLIAIVVRLTYGIAAQKRAEVEFGRVFYTSKFNNAQHRYRHDPDVQSFMKASEKASPRASVIRNIRAACQTRSELLATAMPPVSTHSPRKSPRRSQHNQAARTLLSSGVVPSPPTPRARLITPHAALSLGTHAAFFA